MPFWSIAAPIIGSVLGGLAGRSSAKQSNQPTTTRFEPSSQLGGYQAIRDVFERLQAQRGYSPGRSNPYLSAVFNHNLGRAGVPMPEGGFPNPYMQAMGGGGGSGLSPEMMNRIRTMLNYSVGGSNSPPGAPRFTKDQEPHYDHDAFS